MAKIYYILVFSLFSFGISAQNIPDSCHYTADDWKVIADSLRPPLTTDIQIDTSYAPAFYIALMHYPELYQTSIIFKAKHIKTTAATRPVFWSVFKPRMQREYLILINNKNKPGESVYYPDLPFNARVGLLGHELSHICDYEEMSSLSVIWMGTKYVLSKAYKKKLEHHADRQAITHGLGAQLYKFADYVLNQSNTSEKYKKYKTRYYMTPEEILKEIQVHKDSTVCK